MSRALLAACLGAEQLQDGGELTAASQSKWSEVVNAHYRNMRPTSNEEESAMTTLPSRLLGRMRRSFIRRDSSPAQDQGWVECPATAAVVGGIAAQEVIGAVCGTHLPLNQMLMVEALDCLPEEDLPQAKGQSADTEVQRLYGADVASRLRSLRVAVAGTGAIGCELLKNFANLHIAEDNDGYVAIVDPDSIERSNLNRQLLFR